MPVNHTATRAPEERAAATRTRILNATIDCLLYDGYASTSTSAIQERAGVSRGALTHHYPAKQELMIAAVQHLSRVRAGRILTALSRIPPGGDRLREGIRLAWAEYDGDLFQVALELWTASRTDDELQSALYAAEREIGRHQRELFAGIVGDPDSTGIGPDDVDRMARFMRGTALTNILRRSTSDPDQMVAECLAVIGWRS